MDDFSWKFSIVELATAGMRHEITGVDAAHSRLTRDKLQVVMYRMWFASY
jgi:membrane protein YdbS with pleckstrin-like domain